MGRILTYLSSHWVQHRVSSRERTLQKQNKVCLNEIETLKSRLGDLKVELEIEQVGTVILEKEVTGLTKIIERDRIRVAAEIRDFGITGENEETNVS